MTTTTGQLFRWIPRILGTLVSIYIGIFALDAFGRDTPLVQAFSDFTIHLIPAFVLLGLVVASFRWEWVGAVTFIALAVLYAVTMSRGRVDWMLAISGPLLVVGVLFLLSWLRSSRLAST